MVRRAATWLRGRDRGDWAMAGIVLAGLVLRVAYVLSQRSVPVEGDGEGYYYSARLLADGHGFVSSPAYLLTDLRVPAADHPPAWIVLLSTVALAGAKRVVYFQLLAALVGVATVAAVGATGRQLAGRRCGLIAAAVAALYPNLWSYERVLLCETLALLLTTLCVLFAYRFWSRPGPWDAAAMGLTCGLLAMTRPRGAGRRQLSRRVLRPPHRLVELRLPGRGGRERRTGRLVGPRPDDAGHGPRLHP